MTGKYGNLLKKARGENSEADKDNKSAPLDTAKQEAVKPEKKELLDPDDTAEVQYGSGQKKSSPGAGKKTGTDALKINVNTGGTGGAGTGGLNV